MGQTIKTERQLSRKASKVIYSNRIYLQQCVEVFLKDAFGKTEKEIKDIYLKHESDWVINCKKHNQKNLRNEKTAVATLFEDAFEKSVLGGWKHIKNFPANTPEMEVQKKEFTRIMDIMKERNYFQTIAWWFKKHFLVKGTNKKYKNDAPPPLLRKI